MAKYLLDTNTLVYIINNNPPSVLKKFKTLKIGEVATCSIVVSELYFGIEKSTHKAQNEKALNEMLSYLVIYDFGLKEAREYAKIRAELEQKKSLIGNMDMLICAVARANKLVIVTNNQKEFERVEHVDVENWI